MGRGFIAAVAAALLSLALAGCGNEHRAKAAIGGFLDENLVAGRYKLKILKVDSTSTLSDSVIRDVRARGARDPRYRGEGIRYKTDAAGGRFIYARARIVAGEDTLTQTFYLDMGIKDVVAFKEN